MTYRLRRLLMLILAASLAIPILAQHPDSTMPDAEGQRVMGQVQKAVSNLRYFGVFDWVTVSLQERNLIVGGYASRPELKSEVERALRQIQGVESVEDRMEILPLSPNDNRIRIAVYNRIYTQGALRKYNANQGSVAHALGPGAMRSPVMAGGITYYPPTGYHAIHIVVKNGRVQLFGTVLNPGDVNLAGLMANGVPGAFSVTNHLVAESGSPKPNR